MKYYNCESCGYRATKLETFTVVNNVFIIGQICFEVITEFLLKSSKFLILTDCNLELL